MADSASLPLKDVVLCCTSVPPDLRAELASRIDEMGGVHKPDLTVDVSHLIVGHWDTPKYRYVAKERPDVKVLRLEWVQEVRRLWIENEDFELADVEARYRLPTFWNLKISSTGFPGLQDRQSLAEQIANNGGEYHSNLTPESTHLIAHSPTGEKYKYAQIWKLKIVTVEWLWDSLKRGMILDEQAYHPLLPKDQVGLGALTHRASSDSLSLKRAREQNEAGDERLAKRRLKRTASAKLGGQNIRIWDDIIGVMKPVAQEIEEKTVDQHGKANEPIDRSKAPRSYLQSDRQSKRSGLFYKRNFLLQGFGEKKTRILQNHIQSNDGQVCDSLVELTTALDGSLNYIIIPHSSPPEAQPDPELSQNGLHIVSEWWVERSLHQKELIDPTQVSVRPFSQFPLPSFKGMTICSTGFTGIHLTHLAKTSILMGAIYDEIFSSKADVLICNVGANGNEKVRHSREWNIPSVHPDWLWDCVRSGTRKPFFRHTIPGSSLRDDHFSDSMQLPENHTRQATIGPLKPQANGTEGPLTPEPVPRAEEEMKQTTPISSKVARKEVSPNPKRPPLQEPIYISSNTASQDSHDGGPTASKTSKALNVPPDSTDTHPTPLNHPLTPKTIRTTSPSSHQKSASKPSKPILPPTSPSPPKQASPIKPPAANPPSAPASFTAQLANLLSLSHKSKSSRPDTSITSTTSTTSTRPRRLLGRVPSISNSNPHPLLTHSTSGTRTSSASGSVSISPVRSDAQSPAVGADEVVIQPAPFAPTPQDLTSAEQTFVMPSQQVAYVDVEGERRRAVVGARVGRRGKGKGLERTGTVVEGGVLVDEVKGRRARRRVG
ncbi:MAG: hypothetical protein M1814_004203 [Vezdaea aestivalis]|nr:MAG: hypothetical protein M1814_004203 [Vezdaea aestivalis]